MLCFSPGVWLSLLLPSSVTQSQSRSARSSHPKVVPAFRPPVSGVFSPFAMLSPFAVPPLSFASLRGALPASAYVRAGARALSGSALPTAPVASERALFFYYPAGRGHPLASSRALWCSSSAVGPCPRLLRLGRMGALRPPDPPPVAPLRGACSAIR